jgi:hypothetical protein
MSTTMTSTVLDQLRGLDGVADLVEAAIAMRAEYPAPVPARQTRAQEYRAAVDEILAAAVRFDIPEATQRDILAILDAHEAEILRA